MSWIVLFLAQRRHQKQRGADAVKHFIGEVFISIRYWLCAELIDLVELVEIQHQL